MTPVGGDRKLCLSSMKRERVQALVRPNGESILKAEQINEPETFSQALLHTFFIAFPVLFKVFSAIIAGLNLYSLLFVSVFS